MDAWEDSVHGFCTIMNPPNESQDALSELASLSTRLLEKQEQVNQQTHQRVNSMVKQMLAEIWMRHI